ncbi:HAD family hydrolase [Rhodobacter sphaeroides]|uniref:Branched-chain amino acid aminotransferase n=2 Tax=Cereibacter sphaeroides TaxID=1063 RepID=Q3IYI9_CERS4|nr:branched chain amino acid aminotransferase [Cereibacter sphaeroides]ABA80395.1 putative branched-chain amino acid aminotransferase [Cereibacter sphaeroides 2.4.1]AMJ48627.1 branched-chain amino acid aminotransferase [Cereibacter sphaeroides]ANS35342.1 branched-chain amino acid aminotransferase [Cereibacter sphaeroides]ATN64395.1 branched-chain amino acid aminotransferase [Cereibacter sphaeroides]AXC62583.1 HAD family hydrolase [Cereibacter sphaeroides 2.4.1]
MRIAMWSGPRNLSTAMMYSFAARGDCGIWDEPFYAAYLKATGIDHPMRAEILAAHETDASVIADRCSGEAPLGEPIFYQKHMTLHMIPSFDRGFMRDCENVFLIRHPTRVVASYAKKREGPSLADIGFVQQAKLFDEVAQWLGRPPLVVDSADVRQDPKGMLTALCAALGLPFTEAMLRWPAGGHKADGVWAPHWYGAVHLSSGFEDPEGPLPDLAPHYADLARQALPHYERLAAFRIRT